MSKWPTAFLLLIVTVTFVGVNGLKTWRSQDMDTGPGGDKRSKVGESRDMDTGPGGDKRSKVGESRDMDTGPGGDKRSKDRGPGIDKRNKDGGPKLDKRNEGGESHDMEAVDESGKAGAATDDGRSQMHVNERHETILNEGKKGDVENLEDEVHIHKNSEETEGLIPKTQANTGEKKSDVKNSEDEEYIHENSEETNGLISRIHDDTGLRGDRWHVSTKCLDCLCRFATDCNMNRLKRGCFSTSCGPFGISYVFWEDAFDYKKPDGPSFQGDVRMEEEWKKCSLDLICATESMQKYFNKYHPDCNRDGKVDCLDYAAIHTLGPFGCQETAKINHWNKNWRKEMLQCMADPREGRYTEEMEKIRRQDFAAEKREKMEAQDQEVNRIIGEDHPEVVQYFAKKREHFETKYEEVDTTISEDFPEVILA